MKSTILLSSCALAGVAILIGQLSALAVPENGDETRPAFGLADPGVVESGPSDGGGGIAGGASTVDIAVSRIGQPSHDYPYYGSGTIAGIGDVRVFSGASTSCNVGPVTAEWISGASARHPVIAQNLYRLSADGSEFEQIGLGWLKHSFCAVSETTCGSCSGTPCSNLGIGCADTYWGTLNGDLTYMGPRNEIDPQGYFHASLNPGGPGTHAHGGGQPDSPNSFPLGRLAVLESDLAPMNPDAEYAWEIHYVTHDEEPFAATRNNNASYIKVIPNNTSVTNAESMVNPPGPATSVVPHFLEPAIRMFEAAGASLVELDQPNNGHFNIASKATDNGDGTTHYEYVVHNMNARNGASQIFVPVPECVDVTNIDFAAPFYHSDPVEMAAHGNNTPWTAVRDATGVTWTDTAGNTIEWSTSYTFRFDANTVPNAANQNMQLTNASGTEFPKVVAPADVVLCQHDSNGDLAVAVNDLLDLLAGWGNPVDSCDVHDFDGNGTLDVVDLLNLLAVWGPCP